VNQLEILIFACAKNFVRIDLRLNPSVPLIVSLNAIWTLLGPANNGTPIRLFEKNASAEARSVND
jgi:hypothetical protein